MKYLVLFLSSILFWQQTQAQDWREASILIPSDRAVEDWFGDLVAIDGDYAAVGVPRHSPDTTLGGGGAVFVFKRDSIGQWQETQKLLPAHQRTGDRFGTSIALRGDYLFAGAWAHDFDTANTDSMSNAGAVFVFKLDSNGHWQETQKLTASDRSTDDVFGVGVALYGPQVIVAATGVDDDANGNDFKSSAGAAYIFALDSTGQWIEEQKIVANDRDVDDAFGFSVAIYTNCAIVSTIREEDDTAGINPIDDAGSAYIFEKDSLGHWNQVQKVVASDRSQDDEFGTAAAIYGDYAVVTAAREDHDANGGNRQNDSGSGYVFKRDSLGQWTQVQKIVAADRTRFDFLGRSAAITNEYIAIGSQLSDRDANGGNNRSGAGAAYVFQIDSLGQWNQVQKVVPSDRRAQDRFGWSLDLSGSHCIIGAIHHDLDASGNNGLANSGAAYTFELCTTDTIEFIVEACDSFTWALNQVTYHTSGTYTNVFTNASGCAEVSQLHLTINSSSTSTININACDSFFWPVNGQMYVTSGVFVDSLTSSSGCDSVLMLDLTLNQSDSTYQSLTACDSFFWSVNNTTYTSSGVYTGTTTNMNGCDSTITLNLTILPSSGNTTAISACDSYLWPVNNQVYTSTGIYTDTLTNTLSCDSVLTLNLTINSGTNQTETITACKSYTWPVNNTTYNSSGSYTEAFMGTNGCDSTITLELTITNVNTAVLQGGSTLQASAAGATYQWLDCNTNFIPIVGATNRTFTATSTGDYAVAITQNACTDTSACFPVSFVGITDQVFAQTLKVYPNPTQRVFTIDLGQNYSHVWLTIRTINGQLISQQSYTGISQLNPEIDGTKGSYLVEVKTNTGQTATLEIIKE